jgi:hypothetical protein
MAPIPGNSLTVTDTVRTRSFPQDRRAVRGAFQPLASPGLPRSSRRRTVSTRTVSPSHPSSLRVLCEDHWSQFWSHSAVFGAVQGHPAYRFRPWSVRICFPTYGLVNSWKACWGQPLTSSNLVSSASASPGTTLMAAAARSGGHQRMWSQLAPLARGRTCVNDLGPHSSQLVSSLFRSHLIWAAG